MHARLPKKLRALDTLGNLDGSTASCSNDSSEKRMKWRTVCSILDSDVVMRLVKNSVNNEGQLKDLSKLLACSSSLYFFTALISASTSGDDGSA